MNLANSVLSKIPKFITSGSDATSIHDINFAPSTRAKSLNGTRRDNFRDARLGYTHDFERMSKTAAYSNHIKNSELETGDFLKRETENNSQTRHTDLVTPLHENPLTRSTDSPKNEERHELEVNPDPEPSLSDSSSETS